MSNMWLAAWLWLIWVELALVCAFWGDDRAVSVRAFSFFMTGGWSSPPLFGSVSSFAWSSSVSSVSIIVLDWHCSKRCDPFSLFSSSPSPSSPFELRLLCRDPLKRAPLLVICLRRLFESSGLDWFCEEPFLPASSLSPSAVSVVSSRTVAIHVAELKS